MQTKLNSKNKTNCNNMYYFQHKPVFEYTYSRHYGMDKAVIARTITANKVILLLQVSRITYDFLE